MRNGGDVLNHNNFQASGLEGADSGLTTLTGALDVDLNGLQAVLLGSIGGSLSSALCGKGSGLTGATEAQTAGGSPGQSVTLQVGDGHHGVVERGADMSSALLNYLALSAALDNLLSSPLIP